MRGRLGSLLLPVLLLLAVCLPAAAAEAPAGDDAQRDSLAVVWEEDVKEQQSWLTRLLHRFFGQAPQEGDELDGRAEILVDQYDQYMGKRIEVVIVHSVLRFEDLPDSNTSVWLNSLANRFRSYTREGVVRQFLLFETGDTVDPFTIADSERLLRGLEYINDARIILLPLGPDEESVAVIVEYRDRWPLGVSGTIITSDRYNVGLYTTNLAGRGIRFDNRFIINRAGDPSLGYLGSLSRENMGGTFIDGEVAYEDSWQALNRTASIERRNRHFRIRWVGGIRVSDLTARANGGVPQRYEELDDWVGRVFLVAEEKAYRTGARRTLTPAVSYLRRNYLDRPLEVDADTLIGFHNRRTTLGGLTYQRRTDVKTSYLFRMGEAEDLPHGMTFKVSSGYENGEFHRRTAGSVQTVGVYVDERGHVAAGGIGLSGYWRDGDYEDGVFKTNIFYATPLMGRGRYQHRLYSYVEYVLGIDRVTPDGLRLGNRSGIRDLDDSRVSGDQRLVTKLEWRMFTPWHLLGFRIMTFVFVDGGVIGGENDALLTRKFYTALGVGMRFNNADLVLPTFEFRLGVLQKIDRPAFGLAFDLGNLEYPEVEVPGEKPSLIRYE